MPLKNWICTVIRKAYYVVSKTNHILLDIHMMGPFRHVILIIEKMEKGNYWFAGQVHINYEGPGCVGHARAGGPKMTAPRLFLHHLIYVLYTACAISSSKFVIL